MVSSPKNRQRLLKLVANSLPGPWYVVSSPKNRQRLLKPDIGELTFVVPHGQLPQESSEITETCRSHWQSCVYPLVSSPKNRQRLLKPSPPASATRSILGQLPQESSEITETWERACHRRDLSGSAPPRIVRDY